MAKMTKRTSLLPFQNRAGERFELSWAGFSGQDIDAADYRLFTVAATHATWRTVNFSAIIKKANFTTDADAQAILLTEILDLVKTLLQTADAEGCDRAVSPLSGGWALV